MALSADTNIIKELGSLTALPVAASTKIYQGAMVGVNPATGYARGYTSGDFFAGHAEEQADNSASAVAGAINVNIQKGNYSLQATLSGVAVTDVGKEVFAVDDNTLTLSKTGARVGRVLRYVGTNTCIVEFETVNVYAPLVPELDCESGVDSADHMLIPKWMNQFGLLILAVYGVITEVFAGASQDQGVVTVYDEDDNAITTITVADAGADAAGDVRLGYNIFGATAGDAAKTVAAGKYVDCKVTQNTSGTSAAGKMRVHIIAKPLV